MFMENFNAMRRYLLIPFLLVLVSFGLEANDSSFSASGGQLVPAVETEISVQKEVLTLKRNGDRLRVDVYYEFYNPTSSEKELIVGFVTPAPYNGDCDPKDLFVEQPCISGFRVEMNGFYLNHKVALVEQTIYDEVKREWVKLDVFKDGSPNALPKHVIDGYVKEMESGHLEYLSFDYVYYFDALFVPGVNVVKHTYEYELSNSVDHIFSFPYELTPACRWANGQVDDFTLIVDMGDFATFSIPGTFFNETDQWTIHGVGRQMFDRGHCGYYTGETQRDFWIRNGYIEFKKKNFKPEGELYIYRSLSFLCTEASDVINGVLYGGYHELDIDSEYGFGDGTISAAQARILKNLPFAYRGYVFQSNDLQEVFNKAPWYIPTPSYVPNTSSLTEGERRWVNYWANYKPKVQ